MTPDLLFLLGVLSWGWHCETAFVKAVWTIEAPHQFYGRIGRSRFYAPGGVNKCFLKDFTSEECAYRSIKALRNTAGNQAKMVARLKKYNETWWENNYIPDILKLYRQNKKEAVRWTKNM